MKRLFLAVAAVILSTGATFADDENVNNVNNVNTYDMTVNMDKLSKCLNLTKGQAESVADVHRVFCGEMKLAANADNADARNAIIDKAVKRDLTSMKYILTEAQYKTYTTVLDVTLSNRGLTNNY